MIESLLPAQAAGVAVRGDDPSAWLLPEEAAEIGGAAESRIREFTTARWCARRALEKLGLPASAILRGPRREPLWPEGVVGSITHCLSYRAAAVARTADVLTLGIDAEPHEELPSGVFERISIEEERRWVMEAPGGIHWDRLIFSAKESAYKAWFPLTGKWLAFEDVAVTFAPAEETFRARLQVVPPVVDGCRLTGFSGRYLVGDELVLTAIAPLKLRTSSG